MSRQGRGGAAGRGGGRRGRGGHKVEVSAQNSPETGAILYRYFYFEKTFKYFYFVSPALRRQQGRTVAPQTQGSPGGLSWALPQLQGKTSQRG